MCEWKSICKLTDRSVLGTEGLSCKAPRKKSRAILINEDGKYAVMYEVKSNLHMLPGGGIEEDEDEKAAVIREIFEETGCTCDVIENLGIVYENRYHADTTVLSYFFVVYTKSKQTMQHLTSEEAALGTVLKWCSLHEAYHLIGDPNHDTKQKRFLQARDVAALNEFARLKGSKIDCGV